MDAHDRTAALLEDMLEDLGELNVQTPDWASDKWDHPQIVARTRARLQVLFAIAGHARHLLDGGGDEAVHRLRTALDELARTAPQ